MNTITFKGVNSNTISGLLIQELPAITRPAKRTKRTEIDGRDGDLVEDLGYEAYKKTVRIGLYGSFDVDEISNFFSGSGWAIFSNESGKKYDARIDDGIDFERLLRFREAKVEFIVQPYKKLVSESDVSGSTTGLTVNNQGYVESRPLIKLEGTADAVHTLDIDGQDFATVTIPASGELYLDSEELNAYDATGDQNHKVVGDFPTLPSGNSVLGWTGTLTNVTVTPRSRWL